MIYILMYILLRLKILFLDLINGTGLNFLLYDGALANIILLLYMPKLHTIIISI